MLEVRGDAVVPNCTIAGDANCPATDTIPVSGYLSGADPLARLLGLDFVPGPAQTDVLTVPAAAQVLTGDAARNNVVRFAAGDHGSILSPAASLDVTRSEEHTSELPSLMRLSYAVLCLKKNNSHITKHGKR